MEGRKSYKRPVEVIKTNDRIQCRLASCTNVPEAQLENLDGLHTYCKQNTIRSLVQKEVTDSFAKINACHRQPHHAFHYLKNWHNES